MHPNTIIANLGTCEFSAHRCDPSIDRPSRNFIHRNNDDYDWEDVSLDVLDFDDEEVNPDDFPSLSQ